ncbi:MULTISPECIES: DUF5330 domain-containing protein [unclassified Xanthobacter]|uniref:DUF5330 domain-containing protein n=1 Tax=unclassified Xanthobacter TaxID=2623496 RepID=UPI001EE02D0D|nr:MULTISPECIES: DUF5330 domain-containing protein [unclassified Xanthobacter]
MFFLLRVMFWIGLVLLLLPLGLKGNDGTNVSVFDAFGAAQAVVADVRGFCSRQPEACAVGGQMVTHLTQKAQAGAKWVADAIGTQNAPTPAAPTAPADATVASGGAPEATGALGLTPQDLAPAWGKGDKVQPAAPATSGKHSG